MQQSRSPGESRGQLSKVWFLWAVLISNLMSSFAFSETVLVSAEDTAAEELIQILDQSSNLQGQFSQLQYDSEGALMGESGGSFAMLRPGYFSWRIESPDSQLIIATPEYIWHHDIDLETVTRRPVSQSGTLSPLQILGGEAQLLRAQFKVSKNNEGVFTLTPIVDASNGSPGFSSLSLTLNSGVLAGMEIIDALNQRLLIQFREVDTKAILSPEDFAFSPPEGVDLFFYDE